jgi:hypothetical protein
VQEPAPGGAPAPLEGQVIPGRSAEDKQASGATGEAVQHPGKVMRIASMARSLLEEVRQAELDEASRARLREIYQTSVTELSEVLSPDLREELTRLSLPFSQDTPSESELRIAHAQLVGWLEGLFHGIQAMLFAQQMENRQRLEEMRRGLPPGMEHPQGQPEPGGTYL